MTKSYSGYLKIFALVHGGLLVATIFLNVLVDPLMAMGAMIVNSIDTPSQTCAVVMMLRPSRNSSAARLVRHR